MEELDTQSTQPTDSQTEKIDFGEFGKPSYYGQLVGNSSVLGTIDLCSANFTVGRNSNCSLVLDAQKLPLAERLLISSVHFVLEKHLEDPYSPAYIIDTSTNGTFLNGRLIGKHNRTILMHGNTISIANCINLFVYHQVSYNVPQEIESEALRQRYHIGRKLGSGSFGTVYLLHDTITCKPYALKIVMKKHISMQNFATNYVNEVNIMSKLNHSCAIQMYEFFNEPNSIGMLLEYMHGGDLLTRILDNDFLPEPIAKFYFYQLCHAVNYLHVLGIVHRDLKPENILLKDTKEFTLLKVSDFGSSKFLDNTIYMRTICGTPEYIAPEVLELGNRKKYTNKIDIWSLGVILYTMLSGLLPFYRRDSTVDMEPRMHYKFTLSQPVWRNVRSCHVKKMIYDILNVNPHKRPSIKVLLKNKWFQYSDEVRHARYMMNLPDSNLSNF